jgi:hypothetical protein
MVYLLPRICCSVTSVTRKRRNVDTHTHTSFNFSPQNTPLFFSHFVLLIIFHTLTTKHLDTSHRHILSLLFKSISTMSESQPSKIFDGLHFYVLAGDSKRARLVAKLRVSFLACLLKITLPLSLIFFSLGPAFQ